MHKPLIGITSGEITNKFGKWAPHTYGQSYTYSDAVIHAGGIPVILPLTDDETIWQSFYERCDGFLFAGGNDIDPKHYGHKKSSKTKDVSKFRDAQELALLHMALNGDKPVLAICRGMQLLNVAKGGTLHQHVPTDVENAQNHEVSTKEKDSNHFGHRLRIATGSKLHAILASDNINANSHHHQGIADIGDGLVATAWAEDGLIEGVELASSQFVIGVQPHPESLESDRETRWARLFSAFVQATSSVA